MAPWAPPSVLGTPPIAATYDRIAAFYDAYVTAAYDVPFFVSEAAAGRGAVLELAAGTGRLTIPLLESGARVTAVDTSARMLAVLSEKLSRRHLAAPMVIADVCDLQLPARFELALFPFQAFMEIVGPERQARAVASIARCLVPGGRFICTLHNPSVRRRQVDGVLHVVGEYPAGDGTLVVSGVERGGHPVVTRLQFFEFYGSDGTLSSKLLLPMEFAFIERDRFEVMARDAGFVVEQLHGDYDRSPFDAERSPFMIWDLRLPAHP